MLGPLELSDAGLTVEVSGVRLRRLLLRLAVEKDRVVSASELVEAVWGTAPDERPADETNALQTLVSRLRRVLGGAGAVHQSTGGYRLSAAGGRLATDVEMFAERAAQGRQALAAGDPALAAEAFGHALELWRGQVLADAGEAAYVRPLAARLEDERLDVQAERIQARLLIGESDTLVAELEQLAAQFTIRERFTGQLMMALAAAGRPAEALAAYERLRVFLADELGSDPGPALQAAHLQLLRASDVGAVTRGGANGADTLSGGRSNGTRARSNLRSSRTSFLGREEELRRLSGLLRNGRLATVVGPGGAGKTRLAGVAAAEWEQELVDGVWFVELAPVTDEANIAQAILGSLGVRANKLIERGGDLARMATVDRLIEVLGASECLLVIDNCEHLIGAVAALTDQLLAQCPDLRVLATSREPLGIDGEALCLLSPLSLPQGGAGAAVSVAEALAYPAVQLFADRAAAVSADFVVDESSVESVVEIVRRLDGLPLAIELAAARLRVLPVGEVAARLSDRFRLLTGGSRAAMPRHRTLRAVVEWSWELLTPSERLLAERLAIFPAGATANSVAAVCVDDRLPPGEVGELLNALVDKSLLRVVDEETAEGAELRYRMLETIREYGAEKLADHDAVHQVRLAHAQHYADLVRRAEPWLRNSEQVVWFRRLDRERDNILAALSYFGAMGLAAPAVEMASSLGWYWTLLGSHSEAATWTGFALQVPGEVPPASRAMAECLYEINQMATGFGDGGEDELSESVERMTTLRDRLLDVDDGFDPMVVLLRALMSFFAGDEEALLHGLDEALEKGEPWVQAAALMFRAHMWENVGDVPAMIADAERAYVLFTEIGDRWGLASTLSTLASIHTLQGDLDAAIAECEQSAQYLREFKASGDEAMMHLRLADLHLRRGDAVAAKGEAELAGTADFQAGSRVQRLLADAALAGIALASGDRAAVDGFRRTLSDQLGQLRSGHPINAHVRAVALAMVARLELSADEQYDARQTLKEAYEVGRETKDMPIMAAVAATVAEYAASCGNSAAAAEILGAAAQLRGADDPTDVWVRALSQTLQDQPDGQFELCYQRGKALDRAGALARVDPSSLAG
jgi:predicted ATPase/DNA-binding SARP family transcriptional activator